MRCPFKLPSLNVAGLTYDVKPYSDALIACFPDAALEVQYEKKSAERMT
jgi:hypothetical protein